MPADRRAWGRFTELQDRNFAILRRILEAPADSDGADEGGRLLRRLHGRIGDRSGRPRAARARPDDDRASCLQPGRSSRRSSRTCTSSACRSCSASASQTDQERRDEADCAASIRAASRLPDRDYYLKTDDALGRRCAAKYVAHVAADARRWPAPRRTEPAADAARRARDRDRARHAPRSIASRGAIPSTTDHPMGLTSCSG